MGWASRRSDRRLEGWLMDQGESQSMMAQIPGRINRWAAMEFVTTPHGVRCCILKLY
jgi:hypothetical protein